MSVRLICAHETLLFLQNTREYLFHGIRLCSRREFLIHGIRLSSAKHVSPLQLSALSVLQVAFNCWCLDLYGVLLGGFPMAIKGTADHLAYVSLFSFVTSGRIGPLFCSVLKARQLDFWRRCLLPHSLCSVACSGPHWFAQVQPEGQVCNIMLMTSRRSAKFQEVSSVRPEWNFERQPKIVLLVKDHFQDV